MTEVATAPAAPSEAGELAGELGKAFGRLVLAYEKHFSLSREEAVQRITEPPDGGQRALTCPPDQVSWIDLHLIARTDPDRSTARWEEIKRAALDEVRTGHRAAKAVEVGTLNDESAWQRAQFLALREELSAEWQPRNGIERQLLDTMAQAGYLTWLQNLTTRTGLESCTNDRGFKDEGRWQPPRQSDADALDQAAAMMDRFNRIFLRTLRALCDMRRHSTPVIVQNGGQMNVAQQQVNLNTAGSAGAAS